MLHLFTLRDDLGERRRFVARELDRQARRRASRRRRSRRAPRSRYRRGPRWRGRAARRAVRARRSALCCAIASGIVAVAALADRAGDRDLDARVMLAHRRRPGRERELGAFRDGAVVAVTFHTNSSPPVGASRSAVARLRRRAPSIGNDRVAEHAVARRVAADDDVAIELADAARRRACRRSRRGRPRERRVPAAEQIDIAVDRRRCRRARGRARASDSGSPARAARARSRSRSSSRSTPD